MTLKDLKEKEPEAYAALPKTARKSSVFVSAYYIGGSIQVLCLGGAILWDSAAKQWYKLD